MPAFYIVLQRAIANLDHYVDGRSLSEHNKELEKLAKRANVKSLLEFYRADESELSAFLDGDELDRVSKKLPLDQWLSAAEGLRTIEALQDAVTKTSFVDADKLRAELREFAKVLDAANEQEVGWHLAIDY